DGVDAELLGRAVHALLRRLVERAVVPAALVRDEAGKEVARGLAALASAALLRSGPATGQQDAGTQDGDAAQCRTRDRLHDAVSSKENAPTRRVQAERAPPGAICTRYPGQAARIEQFAPPKRDSYVSPRPGAA